MGLLLLLPLLFHGLLLPRSLLLLLLPLFLGSWGSDWRVLWLGAF